MRVLARCAKDGTAGAVCSGGVRSGQVWLTRQGRWGMVWLRMSWQGRLGSGWLGTAGLVWLARYGTAGLGREGMAGKARSGKPGHADARPARQVVVRHGEVRLGRLRQGRCGWVRQGDCSVTLVRDFMAGTAMCGHSRLATNGQGGAG